VRSWRFWERLGFYIVPRHYYFPIPEEASIREHDYDAEFPFDGINIDDRRALGAAEEVARFHREYLLIGTNSSGFESGGDGAFLYGMLRWKLPSTVLEIGGGRSTEISLHALRKNRDAENKCGRIISIEPFPSNDLETLAGKAEEIELVPERLERIDLSRFDQLRTGGVLFIDSSHLIKTGNDVYYIYLYILPRLKPGIIVHIHDIRFPQDYPREWVVDRRYFGMSSTCFKRF